MPGNYSLSLEPSEKGKDSNDSNFGSRLRCWHIQLLCAVVLVAEASLYSLKSSVTYIQAYKKYALEHEIVLEENFLCSSFHLDHTIQTEAM